jgi:hypothetical protein
LRGDIYLGLRLVYFNYFGLVLAWVDYYLNWTYVRPIRKTRVLAWSLNTL